MDVFCPICGEPWDNDEFHEKQEDGNIIYNPGKSVYSQNTDFFFTKGCGELFEGRPCKPQEKNNDGTLNDAEKSSILRDLLGDDIDGIASEMDW